MFKVTSNNNYLPLMVERQKNDNKMQSSAEEVAELKEPKDSVEIISKEVKKQIQEEVKPKFFPSLCKGFLNTIGLGIPILSQYITGNQIVTDKELSTKVDNLENTSNDKSYVKKKNVLGKTLSGLGLQILYSIPIIGTYFLGKAKNRHEDLKENVYNLEHNTNYQTKHSTIRTYVNGLIEKIKYSIPVFNTYYLGKQMKETQTLNKKVNTLETQK